MYKPGQYTVVIGSTIIIPLLTVGKCANVAKCSFICLPTSSNLMPGRCDKL